MKKKSTNQAWSAKTTNFFYDFLEFVSFINMPITASLSLTSSTTCCTKLKLWQVWKYMYVDGSSLIIRLTYRIPCRQCSGPEWKEKALKKSTSYVGKLWNAYFSLSPTGIAISCITFSSGGKFATPVKKK